MTGYPTSTKRSEFARLVYRSVHKGRYSADLYVPDVNYNITKFSMSYTIRNAQTRINAHSHTNKEMVKKCYLARIHHCGNSSGYSLGRTQ